MNLYELYWIGIRESELAATNHLFSGSITIFGTGKGSNYSFDKEYDLRFDYNQDNDLWINFVNKKANEILGKNPEARFLLYYFPELEMYEENLQKHLIAINDLSLITLLDNKLNTREWLKDFVTVPPYATYIGNAVNFDQLRDMFPDTQEFVVQAEYSCGGSGTWLFRKEDESRILAKLEPYSTYTISPYYDKSISLNIHIIVYEKEILLLPPSVQLISHDTNAFLYKGGDFIMFQYLPNSLKQHLREASIAIGKQLQAIGYRGVCGIDFIAAKEELYFMEINPRFQSSTFLINQSYAQSKTPLSVQELHMDAFNHVACSCPVPDIPVNYSFYCYSYDEKYKIKLHMLWELYQSSSDVAACIDDDLNWDCQFENDTYLFKAVFDYNIAALSPDFKCRIVPNINIEKMFPMSRIEDMVLLKLMLLNHGIRLSKESKEKFIENGGPNHEEFYALDITIRSHIHISVPYLTRISALSPFYIQTDERGRFCLFLWDSFLEVISIRSVDPLGEKRTKNGWKYNEITYLGNDRLRVYHRAGCYFKSNQIGCRFCDIEKNDREINMEDIREAVKAYQNLQSLHHYMIGGGSDKPNSDFTNIIETAKCIREFGNKPIYLMSLPPFDCSILFRLKEAGITEVSFNIEVFDRTLARQYMPGKGSIPLDIYTNAFREAVKLWGKNGNVRSIFIVGLEPLNSLMQGIEYACQLGVSPILSLFKPIEETPMSYLLPPSDQELLELYQEVLKTCMRYGIEMGPSCPCCEDNTLKLTL